MKTTLMALAAFILTSTGSFAQSIDVSAVTCAELSAMDPDGITTLFFWIDGFMGGSAQDSTFDLDRLTANIDGALLMCAENSNATVMEVLQQVENG